MADYEIDKIAFKRKEPIDGYMFEAWYLHKPKGDALVRITQDEKIVREFFWPAYKIWNIAAHEMDIIDGLERDTDDGLLIAGSTGLGGNVYSSKK